VNSLNNNLYYVVCCKTRRCGFLSELWCTLSPQQREIYRLLSQGLNQKQVADALGISARTVQVQVFRIKQKLMRLGDNKAKDDNKNDTKKCSQYPFVLFETPVEAPGESAVSDLIRELELAKGLSLTPQQKEVLVLKSEGKGAKAVAACLGITPREVQDNMEQAVKEIKRVQFGGDTVDDVGACEYIGRKSVKEVQVLSYLSKGMNVKAAADKLGSSESSVRKVMSRSGISAKTLKEQRMSKPRFKNNYYSPPDPELIALMRRYYSGSLTAREMVEAEIVLRSTGLIRSVPAIMKNNGQLLNMHSVQKRKRVFHVTSREEAALRAIPKGMKCSILEYSRALLILVNRYAEEEEETGGTSFTHTYAVDHCFWPAIQASAGGSSAANSDQGPDRRCQEGSVGRGSYVVLRDTDTNETIHVCLAGAAQPSSKEERYVLSPKAPLAEAIYGLKEGESVSLEIIKGIKVNYEILNIQQQNA
jgi:DNA-binding NarL/FixJ family response regulator